jgi:type 1 glutamine amidotransferase
MRILLTTVMLFSLAFSLHANEPINVLIVTGGHDFDKPNFYKMFDEMPDIRYDKAELPKEMDLLAPGLEKKYNQVLTYDMNNFPTVSTEQKERFAKLIETGMPLIVMHHSIGAYENWQPYRKLIGGHYLQKPTEIDGRSYPASNYKYDLDIAVQIADKEHPITKGIANFKILDEGYKDLYIREGVHVLLKTDHPDATTEVAWTNRYGKGVVFTIALGHDKKAYENPNLRKILRQGIQWGVEEARKNK